MAQDVPRANQQGGDGGARCGGIHGSIDTPSTYMLAHASLPTATPSYMPTATSTYIPALAYMPPPASTEHVSVIEVSQVIGNEEGVVEVQPL
jgi:hypothetical protein